MTKRLPNAPTCTIVACALIASLSAATGCDNELGACDQEAANELVYGKNGSVATKGQALVHESCGAGVFCHSASAKGENRQGAPKGMDFDMLPSPTGLRDVLSRSGDVWDSVKSREMPPADFKTDGVHDWLFDVQRRPEAQSLPSLGTSEGRAILQNWLACNAPVVTETRVPSWAQPADDPFADPENVTWKGLYEKVMKPSCATAGCHDAQTRAGQLALDDLCQSAKNLLKSGACNKAWVTPGNAQSSFLVEKLDSAKPSCGAAMPPTGLLSESARKAVRTWIDSGASADECP